MWVRTSLSPCHDVRSLFISSVAGYGRDHFHGHFACEADLQASTFAAWQWPDVKLKARSPQALLRRSCELGMLGRCEMAADGKAAARGTARSAAPHSLLKKDDGRGGGGSYEDGSSGSGGGGGGSEVSSGDGSSGGSNGFKQVSDGSNGGGGSGGTSILEHASGEFGGSVVGDEETWDDDGSDSSVVARVGASEASDGSASARMARPQDLLVGEAATTQQLHAGGRNPASLANEGSGINKHAHTTGAA